jgi:hypothetical protein
MGPLVANMVEVAMIASQFSFPQLGLLILVCPILRRVEAALAIRGRESKTCHAPAPVGA